MNFSCLTGVSFLFFFVLFTLCPKACSQTRQVVDKETGAAVPYVNIWVKGSRVGTSSNAEGYFSIEAKMQDTILFSAVGYDTKELQWSELKSTVALQNIPSYLQEIIVVPVEEKLLVINPIQTKDCKYLYGVGDVQEPWMVGTRIFYRQEMLEADILSKLRFQTRSDVKSALMNIRLYALDSAGFPSTFLINKNLLVELKKGKKINEIDLREFSIRFPRQGIAVVAEWYILPRNRYEYSISVEGQRKRATAISYEPAICTRISETGKNGLVFQDGEWSLAEGIAGQLREFKVELILSNR